MNKNKTKINIGRQAQRTIKLLTAEERKRVYMQGYRAGVKGGESARVRACHHVNSLVDMDE